MDAVFKALADSTRREMLDKLLVKPGQTLSELVADTDMRRQSASKHLQILEEAGLVHIEWEGREKKHFLNPVPIQDINHRWVDKFSKAKTDALLTLRQALEANEPETEGLSAPVAEESDERPKPGPTVTSFFTPLED